MCDVIAIFKKFITERKIIIDAGIKSKIGKFTGAQQKDCEQHHSDLRLKLQKNAMFMCDMKRWLKDLYVSKHIETHALGLKMQRSY